MQVGQFPASAANSLIEGYCDDFVALAAILAQTLEQVSMRGIGFDASRPSLERIEKGMTELAAAIRELLERGSVAPRSENAQSKSADPFGVDSFGAGSFNVGKAQPAASPMAQGPMPPRSAPRPGPAPAPTATPTPQPKLQSQSKPQSQPRPQPAPSTTPSPAPTAQRAPAKAPPAPTPAPSTPAPNAPSANRAAAPQAPTDAAAAAAARRSNKPEGLRGTNRTMPLQSVFQFLGRMRKSGTLHVFVGDEILAFEFVNGCIEFTASNRCPVNERLGELLVELGFCTREALAPTLAKVGVSSANRLGQLVVDAHIVSNGQVLEALEAQVLLRFQRVCQSGEASYEFEAGRRLPGDGRIRIAPFELTIDQPWKLRTP